MFWSTRSFIKLNLLSSVAVTCLSFPSSIDILFSLTCTYVSPITVYSFVDTFEPIPNCPFPLYPVVYTNPLLSDAILWFVFVSIFFTWSIFFAFFAIVILLVRSLSGTPSILPASWSRTDTVLSFLRHRRHPLSG